MYMSTFVEQNLRMKCESVVCYHVRILFFHGSDIYAGPLRGIKRAVGAITTQFVVIVYFYSLFIHF